MTKSGIVTVVGKPNTGKSTLLNRIIGQKLSITSDKPQSTRDRIVGIHTTNDTQMVVLDTPGLLDPAYALQQSMRHAALSALKDADVVVYMLDARDQQWPTLNEAIGTTLAVPGSVITALNKIDLVPNARRDELLKMLPAETIPISALTGEGIDTLLAAVSAALPESPFLYPEEEISTQSLRFFAAELIRETALEQLSEELPYSLACEIDEFRESRTPVYIRAILYVERESQKRIIIGEKGRKIREIGSVARQKIEKLVGEKVYLDLWVKVLQNWRKNTDALRRLGYDLPQHEDR
jgi:GTP-binding protein Era